MTLSMADVRETLSDAVRSTGLACSGKLSDVVTAPCARVFRKEFDPRMVFSEGKSEYQFGIIVFTSRASPETSMNLLDLCAEVSGAQSITAAVQDEGNWSFDLDYVQVTRIGGESIMEVAGVQYLTIDFDVEVVG